MAKLTQAEVKESLDNGNVQAFLRVIRLGEGTSDPAGYRRMFGGKHFESFTDHPRIANTATFKNGKTVTSTAAGAYQFLSKTWDGLVSQYGLADFSEETQDLGAALLINQVRALGDVIAGNFELAVKKCASIWASLPGSPYGQPTITMEKALAKYKDEGGTIATQTAPQTATQPVQPTGEKPMIPFIAAAIPALIEAAPDLIRIFGDSPQAEKNAKAAEKVVEMAKAVTGESTSEGAVIQIQSDPELAIKFREQTRKEFLEIEAMQDKRIGTAREFNEKDAPLFDGAKWYSNIKFVHVLSTVVVLAAIAGIGFILVTSKDPTERAMALQALLLVGFSGIMAYWVGSSQGSDKKTDMIAEKDDLVTK